MPSAREQARDAAQEAWDLWAEDQDPADFANAASDVWEPIARTLLLHVPEIAPDKRTTPLGCAAHGDWVRWPCPEWKKASEALGE